MQLAGELSKISIPSLLQLARSGEFTGEVSLLQGARVAKIYIEDGKVIHVESEIGTGREAFLELFLWLTGSFTFVERTVDDVPRDFPTDEPIDRIMREGAIYLEQKNYLDQLGIGGHTVLKPTIAAKQAPSLPLLDKLDGRRTLAQALSDTDLSRKAFIQTVYKLLQDELVTIAEPGSDTDPNRINIPDWVMARLRQDNSNISQAIVDMVIWVDRVKCWMYQADADLERAIHTMIGNGSSSESKEKVKSLKSTKSKS